MDFKEFLKKQSQAIDTRLSVVLSEISKEAGKADPLIEGIFDKFIESAKDGKRIRGALVLLGYKVGGGKDLGSVIDAAAAFEIFQTAILAQDDVIDKSVMRRSKDSLYQSLGGDHKAISETICLSDIGFFSAFRLITTLKVEDSIKIKVLNLFSQTLTQTVLGEMLDIEVPEKRDFLERDSYKIALLKTARYTISGPLVIGAILAGAKLQLLKKLQIFGDSLGIAFQIQDDILGIFGDEKVIGKSASSDIKECKATLLIAYAEKKGNKEQKGILSEEYGNQEIDQKGIESIKKVFVETGALDYANQQAEKYFSEAKKALNETNEALLYSLVDFLKGREK